MDYTLIKPEQAHNDPSSSQTTKATTTTTTTTTKSCNDESCKYKGVRKRKWGKWVSEIRLPNSRERIWLGSYDSPEKAARAFDAAQVCLRGTLANLNFPDNPPDIPGGQSMTPSEIQTVASRFANTNLDVNQDQKEEQEDNNRDDFNSPCISQDTVVQIDSVSDITRVEGSFHEQLSLCSTLGSGNYVSEFGYFTGFDYMMSDDFHNVSQPINNYDYMDEDTYDNSLYQDTCLWNF